MKHLSEHEQFLKMTQTPIPRLIAGLSVPTIISMLVTSIYNTADTLFVSHLGTSAAGAVGVVFSLMALIQAVGFMLGMGAGSIISRLIGKQEFEAANKIGSASFVCSIVLGLIIAAAGLLLIDPLMLALGSTQTILPFARDYAIYILFGAPVMMASFVLNNILRAQGRAALSMIGLSVGGILNIFLDPLLIFGFSMGISGAAIATLISQCVSFLILLSFFLSKQSIIKLSVRYISRRYKDYSLIFSTGFPSLCRQGLASIATIALNVCAAAYGDSAVAAVSIVGRICLLIVSVMIGFGQGFQPVAGSNYGAKQYARVRKSVWFALASGTIVLSALGLIGFLVAPECIRLFRADDAAVVAIGAATLRAQCLTMPLQPTIILANMTFQGLGLSGQATLVACMRQGIFFLPLVLILPAAFGLPGLIFTQAAADVLSFICCVPLLFRFFRKFPKKNAAAEPPKSEASPA